MREVITYIAECGTEFKDRGECLRHEVLMGDLRNIVKPIGEGPRDSRSYIQHSAAMCVATHILFIERIKHLHPRFKSILDRWDEHHPSHAHHLVSEACPMSVGSLYHRFTCIDKSGRQFSQPYFVTHPNEAQTREEKV